MRCPIVSSAAARRRTVGTLSSAVGVACGWAGRRDRRARRGRWRGRLIRPRSGWPRTQDRAAPRVKAIHPTAPPTPTVGLAVGQLPFMVGMGTSRPAVRLALGYRAEGRHRITPSARATGRLPPGELWAAFGRTADHAHGWGQLQEVLHGSRVWPLGVRISRASQPRLTAGGTSWRSARSAGTTTT